MLNLSKEPRRMVDLVASILQDIVHLESEAGRSTPHEIDRLSVQLRKLLLDGGQGHFAAAWSLLELPGQPLVRASDLDAAISSAQVADRALIWVEAPVAQPRSSDWEVVTDSSKFIPEGLVDPRLSAGQLEPYVYYEVLSADGRSYFLGYVPSTGSVVATKFEPFLPMSRPPHAVAQEFMIYKRSVWDLSINHERDFTLENLLASTAIAVGSQRMSRRNAIGFVANRRGAHIDGSVHTSFRRPSEAVREQQYSGLRDVPSWVDQLHAVFVQVRSLSQYLAASSDVIRFLERWEDLAPESPYWNP